MGALKWLALLVCDVGAMRSMLDRGSALQFAGLAFGVALTVVWVVFVFYAIHWAIDHLV